MNRKINYPIGYYVIITKPADESVDLFFIMQQDQGINYYAVKQVGDEIVMALSFKKSNGKARTLEEILDGPIGDGLKVTFYQFDYYRETLSFCEKIPGWNESPYMAEKKSPIPPKRYKNNSNS